MSFQNIETKLLKQLYEEKTSVLKNLIDDLKSMNINVSTMSYLIKQNITVLNDELPLKFKYSFMQNFVLLNNILLQQSVFSFIFLYFTVVFLFNFNFKYKLDLPKK